MDEHEDEILLTGGTIITIDPKRPRAEALLVRGNRIVAVGSAAEVEAAARAGARRVALEGKTVVPGFNDAHIHLANLGMRENQVNLEGLDKRAIIDRLLAAARELKRGEPLLAFAWDYESCPDPQRRDLDEHFPDRPVVLIQFSGHGAWLNSAALRMLSIDERTEPWEMGRPEVDTSGALTGIIGEPGNYPPMRTFWFSRMKDRRAIRAGLAAAMKRMAEHGITSVQDNSWWPRTVREIARLHRRGEQTCRISCWSLGREPLTDVRFSISRFKPDWYERGPRKFFWDGAFSSRTAWLTEPYADRSETVGSGATAEEIEPRLRAAIRQRRQVAAHSIGDAATAAYCEAFDRLDPPSGLRFRIEHGQLIREEDFERIRRLGMVVSAQPHAAGDPEKDRRLLGEERAARAYPFRRLLDLGIPLAFGSDYPGEATYDPLYGIQLAVDRPEGPAITAEEAIACYTAGGAYAEWKESTKGRLRPGFLADLAVLSADPTVVPPGAIGEIDVILTMVDGRIVHDRAADGVIE
ncbi:MAG: amidohydrolase [Spirochaetota bacterium]